MWSEDRLVSASQGVTVTNGTFSLQLGSVSALPASLFASGDLYLEVEFPTPATATTSSPTWTEGPMTPRNQMATSAYAYNAETLDGLDSANFAQLSVSNTFSSANTIQATSATAFRVQSAAGANSFLSVDTSGSQITIGNAAADATAVLFRLDDKNTTGDPAGVVGVMYYNSFDAKFRCYQGAGWTDCIGAGGTTTLQGAYTSSTGGTTPEVKLDATRGGFDIQDANTTIAGSLFTVRGANGAGLGAALLDVSSTGVTTLKNSINSTAAFSVQNAAGTDLIKVDTINNNISIGGVNGGEPQPWQTGTPLTTGAQARDNTGAVAYNGYIYIPAGDNGTTIQTTVAAIKIKSNGSLDTTWTTTGSSVPSRTYHTVAQANGYMYILGGSSLATSADVRSEVYVAKINTDGTVGAFTATASLPAARKSGGVTVMNGYMYYMGGDSSSTATETRTSTVYYTKIKPDGSLATWATATGSLSGPSVSRATLAANGNIYYFGGSGLYNEVYSSTPNKSTGNISAWTLETNSLPAGSKQGSPYVMNGYVYLAGGENASVTQTTVYYAQLNSDGSVGTWTAAGVANRLPAARTTVAFTQANGYMYAIGGYTGSAATSTSYYSSTPRVSVVGSLDLVGQSGEYLTDGGTGGELTAGNSRFVGTLEVQDSASFNGTVNIKRDLNVEGLATFRPTIDNEDALLVENAAGTEVFTADTETTLDPMEVQIGSNNTLDTVQINLSLDSSTQFADQGTCGTSTNQGSMYYNTATSTTRMCVNGAWEDMVSTGGLGLLAFGVVPDSGNAGSIGDIAGITQSNSPCKVYWSAAQQVTVAPCYAYSGGRRLTVASTNLSTTGIAANAFVNVCLTGANGVPALVGTANAADNASPKPTWSANNPILCLATLQISTTIGNISAGKIYDVRTFTTTQKTYATSNTALGLGWLVVQDAANNNRVTTTATAGTGNIRGVVVAYSGAISTTAANTIIATGGPVSVKATGTNAANALVQATNVAGHTATAAANANVYSHIGVGTRTIDTTCTSNATCQYSQFLNPMVIR